MEDLTNYQCNTFTLSFNCNLGIVREDTPRFGYVLIKRMTTMTETRVDLEKLDQQIIALLAERVQLCNEARARSEGLESGEVLAEMLSFWIEEAIDRGLDETLTERVAGLVIRMCRAEDE